MVSNLPLWAMQYGYQFSLLGSKLQSSVPSFLPFPLFFLFFCSCSRRLWLDRLVSFFDAKFPLLFRPAVRRPGFELASCNASYSANRPGTPVVTCFFSWCSAVQGGFVHEQVFLVWFSPAVRYGGRFLIFEFGGVWAFCYGSF